MAFCIFALIACEFLPVSLLTPLTRTLQISEGLAGYGLAISGVFAVITSLTIASVARSINRKTLLLLLTVTMGLSTLVLATAKDYETYMVGRALIGIVVGGFWSMSAAIAMRLVPPHNVPTALAIFNGGNALATVIAAPLGSYLGSIIGWRGTFFSLIPVVLAVLFWQWHSLPPLPAKPRHASPGSVITLLQRPVILLGMLATGSFFMGQFVLFTYIRPFLENITRVNPAQLSLILLGMGIAGFIGTTVIGVVLKKRLWHTLTLIPMLMAAIGIMLTLINHHVFLISALLLLWGLTATAAPAGWWYWLAQSLPENAEAGGGLMVAVIQLCIALGSTLGGMLLDSQGYRITFCASAALLVLSALLTLFTRRNACAI